MFSRFFIDRPIFASVLSIIVTLAGAVALFSLPVAQYPEITPPTIEVSAVFPGANAQTVADTVAAPIEQQVNGVENMLYMASVSSNDGSYTLTITFQPGIDLNIAQILVQNRVNLALPVLPELVRRRGVTVKKKSPSQLMIINLYHRGTEAGSDPQRRQEALLYLSNYATIQLRDELARLEGVGDIAYLGQRDYSMRLWLDPEKLASKGLTTADVVAAVEQQNAQVAAGQVGQPPAPTGQAFQFPLNAEGRLSSAEQFAEMIIKADAEGGRLVRLRDVARVELGALNYDQTCTLDGRPSVALSVYQLPGSNALEVARRVRAKMEELRPRFPEGIDYAIVYDTTPFIEESIREVFHTLRDAVILVALVMLLFLRSWRAALVPLAAVPTAIIGAFAVMAALGYTINTLTLFGLVLAVGIVVDDAIVVVEAVQHHIERGLPPREATALAMEQVAGPVIAIGLVLAAVFVPCVFISGIVGQFYRQFAVTIAVSTLLSVFNSLTLSPALCALLLRDEEQARDPLPRLAFPLLGAAGAWWGLVPLVPPSWPAALEQWGCPPLVLAVGLALGGALLAGLVSRWGNRLLAAFFTAFHSGFERATQAYLLAVGALLRAALLGLAAYAGLVYLTWTTLQQTPSGFIPAQDKGYLLVNVILPDAAALGRTEAEIARLEQIALQTPGVKHTVSVAGQSVLLGTNAPNLGTLYVMLEPFEQRRSAALRAEAIAERLRASLAEAAVGAEISVLGAPPVDGLGTAGGFKLVVLDPSAGPPAALEEAARSVVQRARQQPQWHEVFTGLRTDTPWLYLDIDRDAAYTLGVPTAEILNALQVYFGSYYINDFNLFGRTWQVNVQADAPFRDRLAGFRTIWVRSRSGAMVPLANFLHVRDSSGPVMIQRYNLYNSAAINALPAAGVSSGEAIAALEQASADLPRQYRTAWTELALLQLQTQDTVVRAFVLSVVLVFLVLAAQYESWALPLAVILVVPLCLLSAAWGVGGTGREINIFTQVGFIVLVGLASKNAILIVEFARRRALEDPAHLRAAALEACRLRLRPIVMTSLAFIIGVLPLVVAEGAGAEMRQDLGVAVFAGMLGVTLFGIFLTPLFFLAIQQVVVWFQRSRTTATSPATAAASLSAAEASGQPPVSS
ncbi:efflux RND transporter permease subunit [Thermogemmata fonticola]|uniref:Efflux RND transporter permease subunit n=1 Tax=Thermogemmata fonticola TaxID=2755323 RepID=A0A7V8VET2_9BACT|nr:efflux RND transporter permease subunit [Thermogemmata fonticola]MBA2226725.1 efflux RND transporter permease subunit [Thermogemmata fonticola]